MKCKILIIGLCCHLLSGKEIPLAMLSKTSYNFLFRLDAEKCDLLKNKRF